MHARELNNTTEERSFRVCCFLVHLATEIIYQSTILAVIFYHFLTYLPHTILICILLLWIGSGSNSTSRFMLKLNWILSCIACDIDKLALSRFGEGIHLYCWFSSYREGIYLYKQTERRNVLFPLSVHLWQVYTFISDIYDTNHHNCTTV